MRLNLVIGEKGTSIGIENSIDTSLSQLLAISGDNLPSVILFRLGNENYNLINQRLTIVLRDCTKALKTGAIVSVTDRIFRIRLLPI